MVDCYVYLFWQDSFSYIVHFNSHIEKFNTYKNTQEGIELHVSFM
jgi:hypothetical protein